LDSADSLGSELVPLETISAGDETKLSEIRGIERKEASLAHLRTRDMLRDLDGLFPLLPEYGVDPENDDIRHELVLQLLATA
jgi:hypothetical protein